MNVRYFLAKVRQAIRSSAFWRRVLIRHQAHVAYRATMVAHRHTLVASGAILKRQLEVHERLSVALRQASGTLSDQVIDLKAELFVLEAELELASHGEREAKEAVAAAARYLDELTPPAPARSNRPW